MFDTAIFDRWLDDEAERVLHRLKSSEPLTQDDKLIIVLKGQANHFHHLDVELREEMQELREEIKDVRSDLTEFRGSVNGEFKSVNEKFKSVGDEFKSVRDEFKSVREEFKSVNDQFKSVNDEFKSINNEFKRLYAAINTQTWRMIGAIGLIVLLGRLIDSV